MVFKVNKSKFILIFLSFLLLFVSHRALAQNCERDNRGKFGVNLLTEQYDAEYMRTICNTLYVGKVVQVPIERGSSYRRDNGKVLGIGGKQVTVQLLEGRQETFEMRCTDFYEYAETKNLLSQNPELQRIEKKRVEQMQKLENYCKK